MRYLITDTLCFELEVMQDHNKLCWWFKYIQYQKSAYRQVGIWGRKSIPQTRFFYAEWAFWININTAIIAPQSLKRNIKQIEAVQCLVKMFIYKNSTDLTYRDCHISSSLTYFINKSTTSWNTWISFSSTRVRLTVCVLTLTITYTFAQAAPDVPLLDCNSGNVKPRRFFLPANCQSMERSPSWDKNCLISLSFWRKTQVSLI